MRKLTGTIARTNTTCIFINQLREKIGQMFGPTETTTGGNALKFYSSVRLDIRSRSTLKDGDNVLGRHTVVKVVKNKVAPPFRRAEFDIMFGEGISRSSELIDLGVELNIIAKSGSWFSYNGTKLAQGREAAKRMLEDNPELADEIEKLISEALADPETGKKKKPAKSTAAAAANDDEADAVEENIDDEADNFDDLPEEFSIEEDL